jgi:hypothetical protein
MGAGSIGKKNGKDYQLQESTTEVHNFIFRTKACSCFKIYITRAIVREDPAGSLWDQVILRFSEKFLSKNQGL